MTNTTWNGEWVLWELTRKTTVAVLFTRKEVRHVILPGSREHLHKRIDNREMAYLAQLHRWKQEHADEPVAQYVAEHPMTGADIETDYQIVCGLLQEYPDTFSFTYCDAIACDAKKFQLECVMARFR